MIANPPLRNSPFARPEMVMLVDVGLAPLSDNAKKSFVTVSSAPLVNAIDGVAAI